MDECKKELVDYIEEFPQFEVNTLEEIYDKMVQAIQSHNALNDDDKMLCVGCIHGYITKKKSIRRRNVKD